MKFKMNNRQWEIEEVDAQWLLELLQEESPNSTYCFGATKYNLQKIFINKELPIETKKQTLYHELMHCYIWSYLSNQFEYNEEQFCDISANSHDIIHKIVEDYFNKTIITFEDPRFTYLSSLEARELDRNSVV